MRVKLLLLLCCYAGLAQADWTGIMVRLADHEADWKFNGGTREAQISSISFEIEEKTNTDLRVGFGLGYTSVRLLGSGAIATRSFDGEYLKVFLRQPIKISERFSLHTGFEYRYNTARDGDEDDPADIDWSETVLELGASLRFSQVRVTPFASYYRVDGDVSADSGTEVFDIDEPLSTGVRFDIFVEDSAFVRIAFQSGDYAGGYLSFNRQY